MLQTYNDDGVINTYTYGLQRIDSKGEINETYLYDGRGSVVGAVDNTNEFVSYSYTAYGKLMPDSPEPNVFGYNAEATDYSTGLQYLRARYYDTTVQRFVQEDDYRGSFTEPQTMNRYIYVGSNPANRIDPSGYGWLKDKLQAAGQALSSAAQKAVSTTSSIVKSTVSTVKTTTEKTVNKVTQALNSGYNYTQSLISSTKSKATNFVKNTWDAAKSTATNLFNKAKDAGIKAYNEIKDKVTNKKNEIINKVTNSKPYAIISAINEAKDWYAPGMSIKDMLSQLGTGYYLDRYNELSADEDYVEWMTSDNVVKALDGWMNFDESTGSYYFADDAIQMRLGYCDAYDLGAGILDNIVSNYNKDNGTNIGSFDVNEAIIEFEYEGKEYLIEAWMGQYGPSNGAEIGLYEGVIDIPGEIFDVYRTYSSDSDDFLREFNGLSNSDPITNIDFNVTIEDSDVVLQSTNKENLSWDCILHPVTSDQYVDPDDGGMMMSATIKLGSEDVKKAIESTGKVRIAGEDYMLNSDIFDEYYFRKDSQGNWYLMFQWDGVVGE